MQMKFKHELKTVFSSFSAKPVINQIELAQITKPEF